MATDEAELLRAGDKKQGHFRDLSAKKRGNIRRQEVNGWHTTSKEGIRGAHRISSLTNNKMHFAPLF